MSEKRSCCYKTEVAPITLERFYLGPACQHYMLRCEVDMFYIIFMTKPHHHFLSQAPQSVSWNISNSFKIVSP